jgi:PKD repeat protein
MKKLFVMFLAVLFVFTWFEYGQATEKKVFAIYYSWYENDHPYCNTSEIRSWKHWNADQYDHPTATNPPVDIASDYYPLLGPYENRKYNIIKQHMIWMKNAGVEVVVLSYKSTLPVPKVRRIMDYADKQDLDVCFLLEPEVYNPEPGNPEKENTVDDYLGAIESIYKNFKDHSAFLWETRPTFKNPNVDQIPRGVFFIWTYSVTEAEWAVRLNISNSETTIRGKDPGIINLDPTDNIYPDAIIMQKANLSNEIWRLTKGYCDGLYTYKGSVRLDPTGFSNLASSVESIDGIFCIGVSPGYSQKREKANPPFLSRSNGDTYIDNWNYAIGTVSSWAAIVTFNEWHEGTQVEPASVSPPDRDGYGVLAYETYNGAMNKTGTDSQFAYITGEAVTKAFEFRGAPPSYPDYSSSVLPLFAEFTSSSTIVEVGGSITFEDKSLNDPTSWSWVFEGGSPAASTSKNPSITYNNEGTFSVELRVENSGSGCDKIIKHIEVLRPPVANFTADNTTVNGSESVQFTDLSTRDPISWSWQFSGGSPSTSEDQNPTVVYDSLGQYDVTLTVSNRVGDDTEIKLDYITVECFTPDAPGGIMPKDGQTTSTFHPTFEWEPVSADPSVTNYNIIIKTASGTDFLPPTFVGNVTSWKLTSKLLECDTDYKWKVRAYNACGLGDRSPWYFFKSPDAPEEPVAVSPKDEKITNTLKPVFVWESAVSGCSIQDYEFKVKKISTGEIIYGPKSVGIFTSFQIDIRLDTNTEYLWRVRAKNEYGWSHWSTKAYFTTPN